MEQGEGVVLSGKAKGLEAGECDSLLGSAGERIQAWARVTALERSCNAHTTTDASIPHHSEPVYHSTIPDSNETDFQVLALPPVPVVCQIWRGPLNPL